MNYTEIFNGFQIRDLTFIDSRKPPNDIFDVVRWSADRSHCWSVATLEYDHKNETIELTSVGLRWLEAHPSEEVENWLLTWCKYKEIELSENIYK